MKKALLKVAVMLLCLAVVTPSGGSREGCKSGDFDR